MKNPWTWRTQSERYQLRTIQCPECARIDFPPRPVCPTCHTSLLYRTHPDIGYPCAGFMTEAISAVTGHVYQNGVHNRNGRTKPTETLLLSETIQNHRD